MNSFYYDIKNESTNINVISEINPIKKILLYKNGSFDCDSSKYSKEMYKKLWNWKTSGNFCFYEQFGCEMGIDTMNSFLTTFNWFINTYFSDFVYALFNVKYIQTVQSDTLVCKWDEIEKEILQRYGLCLVNKIKEFAYLTHTIGNFSLVPKKINGWTIGKSTFNTKRATVFKDFWDLSLLFLKENMTSSLFCEYIKYFRLDMYMANRDVVLFWKNHNKDNVMPKNIDDYYNFLNIVCANIKKRNELLKNFWVSEIVNDKVKM